MITKKEITIATWEIKDYPKVVRPLFPTFTPANHFTLEELMSASYLMGVVMATVSFQEDSDGECISHHVGFKVEISLYEFSYAILITWHEKVNATKDQKIERTFFIDGTQDNDADQIIGVRMFVEKAVSDCLFYSINNDLEELYGNSEEGDIKERHYNSL